MTNEELVLSIRQGDKSLIPELWEQVQKLIISFAWKYYIKYESMCSAAGITAEDLIQEGYFALLDAVTAWTPESNCVFNTFLNYPIKNRFNAACGIRGSGRNLLNESISLETPIGVDELTLGDTIEVVESGFEGVEQSTYLTALHNDLESAFKQLSLNQERVIKSFYYYQNSMQNTEKQLCLPTGSAQPLHAAALRKLRQSRYIMSYREDIIYTYAFRSSLNSFKDTGISSTERAVEALDNLNK